MKKPPAPDRLRRRWLAGTSQASLAGAVAAVLGPAAAAAPPAPATVASATTAPRQRGYHETEHTRRYYALARY